MISKKLFYLVVFMLVALAASFKPASPIKCKANEVYSPCRKNCPPQTCASIYTSYNCQIPAKCEPGCDCVSEYLRNGTVNDPCIPSHLCPTSPPCPEGEIRDTCGSACPITCENINDPPMICTLQCVNGCFCPKGTYRDKNNKCTANCSN